MGNLLWFFARQKGSNVINESSGLHGDSVRTFVGQTVHQMCRKEYVNKNITSRDLKKKSEEKPTSSRSLRKLLVSELLFSFQSVCQVFGLSLFRIYMQHMVVTTKSAVSISELGTAASSTLAHLPKKKTMPG